MAIICLLISSAYGFFILFADMSSGLADIFTHKQIVTHGGGHYVPGKKQIYVDFINEIVASKDSSM